MDNNNARNDSNDSNSSNSDGQTKETQFTSSATNAHTATTPTTTATSATSTSTNTAETKKMSNNDHNHGNRVVPIEGGGAREIDPTDVTQYGLAKPMIKRLKKDIYKNQVCGMELTQREREQVAETLVYAHNLKWLAYWYQWAAMFINIMIILIGVAVPVFISLQSQTTRFADTLKYLGIGFSAFGTLITGLGKYLKFDVRGEKLNRIGNRIEDEFRMYRALTGTKYGPPEKDEEEEKADLVIPNLDHVPLEILQAIITTRKEAPPKPKDPWETHTSKSFKTYISVVSPLIKEGLKARDVIFSATSDDDKE